MKRVATKRRRPAQASAPKSRSKSRGKSRRVSTSNTTAPKAHRVRRPQDISRWYMPIFSVAVLVLLLHLANDGEEEFFTPEARAAMTDTSMLMRHRQADIGEATQALRLRLLELEDNWAHATRNPEFHPDTVDTTLWKNGVEELSQRYHIWGTQDRQHPDARAEDALHVAVLYLYSIESSTREAFQTGDWTEVENLKEKFRQSLGEANVL